MALKDLKWSMLGAVRVLSWYAIWFTLLLVGGIPAYLLSDVLSPPIVVLWFVALLPCTAFMTHAIMVKRMVTHHPDRDGAKSVTVIKKRRRS